MSPVNESPVLPTDSDFSWRSLQAADVGAVRELAASCLDADGGLALGAEETFITKYYFPAAPGASIGAFEQGGQLVACAAVHPDHSAEAYFAMIVGQVHPSLRHRGLGRNLLSWSIDQAGGLLAASPPDRAHILQIRTESLTVEAASLFERYGFVQQFAEDVMCRELSDSDTDILLPVDIQFATWESALVDQFFIAYQESFRDRHRPGFPSWSQEEWVAWVEPEDEEFHPELSLLVFQEDLPIGFIVCAENWIVQMGVVPEWRGRGIGSAMLMEVMASYREMGVDRVLLDVNVNNARAARVYAKLGFKVSGRRARYEKVLS